MNVTILIPASLRAYTGGQGRMLGKGVSIGEALWHLAQEWPLLRLHLFTDSRTLKPHIDVYLNADGTLQKQSEGARLKESDVLSIICSIADSIEARVTQRGESNVLSAEELLRYRRHLIMPEIGIEGQRRLKEASVLLIGMGGLGSPLGLYLAASGVGRLGIVDSDVVELTNLHRQILYSHSDVGMMKVAAAERHIHEINSAIQIQTYNARLTSENALSVIGEYDIIVDGSDNFPTRYLVNDSCVLLDKPLVYGSIFRFEGQASVFHARVGPCYRCLYPTPPPMDLAPGCDEAGVLGVLPGIIGSVQALETIKLIVGVGEPLVGRLLLFDALNLRMSDVKLSKDPHCPVCGSNPTIRALIDYEEFCSPGQGTGTEHDQYQSDVTVEELRSLLNGTSSLVLVDVREPVERSICSLGGLLVPLRELQERIHELDSSREIIVYCKSGHRSAKAARILRNAGFPNVRNLAGGIDAWARRIDPSMRTY